MNRQGYRFIAMAITRCFLGNSSFSSSSPGPPLVPVQLPSRMETHFWYIVPDEVKSGSLLNQYMELLSPCERENVLSMGGDQLQKRALLARTLVRTTIARYQINHHLDPQSLTFKRNIHGKPEVEWKNDDCRFLSPLHFNISHTSSLIACGVTTNSPIGIDVEEKQRKIKNNVLTFARRYFTPREVDHLSSISDPECQRQELVKLWTLKEAYVKALGKGFSANPFKTFTIQMKTTSRCSDLANALDSAELEIIVEPSENHETFQSNWQFALLEVGGSHYASICTEKDPTSDFGMKLAAWKTIPFVRDERLSGSNVIMPIGGLIKQL